MDPRESVRFSLRSIRGHPLRSSLTVLGVLVGVAAVITFVTFGASLKTDVVDEFDDSPADRIYLVADGDGDGGPPAALAQPVFTEADVATLRNVEGVGAVVPQGPIPTAAVERGNDTVAREAVTATAPAQFDGAAFADGEGFSTERPGLVVNREAAGLFADNLSVGDRVTITRRGGDSFELAVVGVLADETSLDPLSGFGSRPAMYVPTAYYDRVVESPTTGEQQRVYPQVTVVATNPSEVGVVSERVEAAMADSDASQLSPPGATVTTRTNDDIVERVTAVIDRLTGFVTAIAVISLVVGAIGIANIMLVSVRERTKEIGIMKAVGATNRDVLQLFLVEAVLLGLFGALVGTPVGIAGGYVAARYADLSLTVLPVWIAVAVGVGVVVGALAGLYPAWTAARVDPIDALRYE